MEFGVRPEAKQQEDIYGYLLRVMYLNGIAIPAFMNCYEKGLGSFLKTFGSTTESTLEQNIESLSLLTRQSSNTLRSLWKAHHTDWSYRCERDVRSLKIPTPRLCLSCVLEHEFINTNWSNLTTSACYEHNEKLIHNCPNCDVTFRWNSDLFVKCPNCNIRWDALDPTDRYFEPSKAELSFNRFNQKHSGFAYNNFATCFLRALIPFDLGPQQISTMKAEFLDSNLIQKAYELWTYPDARSQHQTQFEKHWSPISSVIPQNYKAIEVPYYYQKPPRLNKHLTQTKGMNTDTLLMPKLRKVVTDTIPSECIVNGFNYARLLRINRNDLPVLIDKQVIQPVNSGAINRDLHFDIRSVDSLLNLVELATDSQQREMVKVSSNDRIFAKHKTRFGSLLADVILKRVSGFRSDQSHALGIIYVQSEDFEKWLSDRLLTS
ncbi:TniQ family protein [Marinobacterium sp. xm-d-509]|uniref:TniQ family protein n=1 Tax=Marinobacterium sp. xm-d-509 TaxID=2497739 RepID=UPI001569012D|nr:TniQ family protein [Marinobacterium sp. xm-d-509]NRP83212.1 hypothetical protein [Marinobacterium sp. xm-d-509]